MIFTEDQIKNIQKLATKCFSSTAIVTIDNIEITNFLVIIILNKNSAWINPLQVKYFFDATKGFVEYERDWTLCEVSSVNNEQLQISFEINNL
ncbi:hypothetical protein ACTS91_17220 [Empedobacter falsenii]